MKLIKNTCLILLSLIAYTSCSDDDNGNTPSPLVVDPTEETPIETNTIADFVAGNADYSILLEALQRVNLAETFAGETEYTVFAPNNAAFANLLTILGAGSLDDIDDATLTATLLNHVVSGSVLSGSLSTNYFKTIGTETSSGNFIDMYIDTSNGVVINGMSTVTTADITVDNGVIHAIDEVIQLPSVVTFATTNPALTKLVAALTRESSFNYVETLSTFGSPAPFTVFAPVDEAFSSLLGELTLNELADIPTATLESTLNTHVVSGANVVSNTIPDGLVVDTLGDNFTINTSNGVKFLDLNGRDGNIIITDIQAANGIIHVVDKVILPQL